MTIRNRSELRRNALERSDRSTPWNERPGRGHPLSDTTPKNLANFIWQVADLLRGDYKRSDYGKVILPLTVLRRLECVLEPTRDAVLAEAKKLAGRKVDAAPFLTKRSKQRFYSTTRHTLASVANAPDDAAKNLNSYLRGLSPNAQEAFEKFRLRRADPSGSPSAKLLYLVVSRFADIDLHPDTVSNHEMGYVFEELIRRFAEASNETAGEHFTPREVIQLMVDLLIAPDADDLAGPRRWSSTSYDPACGTGGMLTAAEDHITSHQPAGQVVPVRPGGQPRVVGDLPVGHDDQGPGPRQHQFGNSFSDDGHSGTRSSTTCWPTHRSAWSGRRSRTRSRTRPSSASAAASAPACRASTTARSCSCST